MKTMFEIIEAVFTLDEGPAIDRMIVGVDEAWQTVKEYVLSKNTDSSDYAIALAVYKNFYCGHRDDSDDFVRWCKEHIE